jgi:hypothetical protein
MSRSALDEPTSEPASTNTEQLVTGYEAAVECEGESG